MDNDFVLASWRRRLAAQLMDWTADPFMIALGVWLIQFESGFAPWLRVGLIASWAIYLVVDMQRQGRTGQTLAKQWLGLRVVDAENGAPVGSARIWRRWATHVLDSVLLYSGWVRPLWDGQGQTFADKFRRTFVV